MSDFLLSQLEIQAEEKNIHFSAVNFKGLTAVTFKDDSRYDIFIQSEIKKSVDILSVLRHEMAHIQLSEFYDINSSSQLRKDKEWKVKRLVSLQTIPPTDLKVLLSNNTPIWEIADLFNITEVDVLNAIDVYKTKEWL